jgi:glutamate dehydrogenase
MQVSTEARKKLSEHGVIIIKESSANKGGVITSSYEILAGMLLNEAEFLSIRDLFISQVSVCQC